MIRNCSIEEISDGKLYDLNDMVKVYCNDCKGCSACCQNMGNSIVLDPLDLFRLKKNLNLSFDQLLKDRISLNVVDGIILPNINMLNDNNTCVFLDIDQRCSIHSFRPAVCRLFPLGRYYIDNGFKYIIQKDECVMPNKSKVKVKKWIDTPNINRYEEFNYVWHKFIKEKRFQISNLKNDVEIKSICLDILNMFFVNDFNNSKDDLMFYEEFFELINRNSVDI